MNYRFLIGALAAVALPNIGHSAEMHPFDFQPRTSVHSLLKVEARNQKLSDVLDDIHQRSGIEFTVPVEFENDILDSTISANTWHDVLKKLLSSYSQISVADADGRVAKVILTGRNGNGTESALLDGTHLPSLFQVAATSGSLPDQFAGLADGSVQEIAFSHNALFNLALGDRLSLKLPTGDYEVVHDNVIEHDNGDKTWIGFLDQEGKEFRVVVTMSVDGNVGQITTPEGTYHVESNGGRDYLVNINKAGLQTQSLQGDDLAGQFMEARYKLVNGKLVRVTSKRKKRVASSRPNTGASALAAAGVTATGATQIDLMVAYTPGFGGTAPLARINNLIALANQAYIDSQVNISLRLVYTVPVAYTETNGNAAALTDVTFGRGAFKSIPTLRKQHGADLVAVLRPFIMKSQANCGTAWVGGANGGPLQSTYGYSVVSDGTDYASKYYCSKYTLTHELGHNMGSAHDKAHSSFPGKYAFSYGYGVSGLFGTIMSYLSPEVGLFSNPSTLCKGKPCGVASAADNAQSLNLTAKTVGGFMPTVHP
jgi:hypothetical protein